MYTIVEVLIERDGMTKEEATEYMDQLRQSVIEGEDPEEILEELGLEPDYIMDLIDIYDFA